MMTQHLAKSGLFLCNLYSVGSTRPTWCPGTSGAQRKSGKVANLTNAYISHICVLKL